MNRVIRWLGTAAAVGIIAMMLAAMGYHIRARDRFEIVPSVVVTVAAALYLYALNTG